MSGAEKEAAFAATAKYCADILQVKNAEDRFAAVLLRRKVWRGRWVSEYLLNARPHGDDVYAGRIGLFGGKLEFDQKKQKDESWFDCAVRELKEETGLAATEVGPLTPIGDLTGTNSAKRINEGAIFIAEIEFNAAPRIRAHIDAENVKIAAENGRAPAGSKPRNPIGGLFVLKHFGGGRTNLWRSWPRLTPQASFALITAFDAFDKHH